jgi:hypothetical protein
MDSLGAGLVVTLTSSIWDIDTQPLDLESKHQIFAVTAFDFQMGVVNYLQDWSGGACGGISTFCVLVNTYGLVVFHPDFQRGNGVSSGGGKPFYNTFLGLREPDLADALIENNLLHKLKNTRSADSTTLTTMFRLNEKKISDLGGVASGTLDSSSLKCLKSPAVGAPPMKWFLSQVAYSNLALLVVDGYVKKSGVCLNETLPDPPTERIKTSCGSPGSSPLTSSVAVDRLIRAPPSDKRLFHKCAKCSIGSYGSSTAAAFLVVGTDDLTQAQEEKNELECSKCPSGYITATVGLRSCSACESGKVASQASEDCNSCPHGKTSDAGSIVCSSCPAGWFATPKISLNALSAFKEPSYCQTCPKGWYQDKAGMDFCINCPEDTYGPSDGSFSSIQCLNCDAERTTASSVPGFNVSSSSSSSSASSSSASLTTNSKSAVAFTTKSKEDDVCFCKGVTDAERKAAQNQYTDGKYKESVLKVFGSYCEEWDNIAGSPYKDYCPEDLDICSVAGNWCPQHWCFVNDPEACAARGFDVSAGTVFATASGEPNTFYSFGICGYPNCYDVSGLHWRCSFFFSYELFLPSTIFFFLCGLKFAEILFNPSSSSSSSSSE